MKMYNPPNAGEFLKRNYIDPFLEEHPDITFTALAEDILGIKRKRLYRICNGDRIRADIASKLAGLFPNTDVEFWLNLQAQRRAWELEQDTEATKEQLAIQVRLEQALSATG